MVFSCLAKTMSILNKNMKERMRNVFALPTAGPFLSLRWPRAQESPLKVAAGEPSPLRDVWMSLPTCLWQCFALWTLCPLALQGSDLNRRPSGYKGASLHPQPWKAKCPKAVFLQHHLTLESSRALLKKCPCPSPILRSPGSNDQKGTLTISKFYKNLPSCF